MKFWKDFLEFIERQFGLLVSKIQVLSNSAEIICENMISTSFKANSEPIKKVTRESCEILPANESRLNLIIQNNGTDPCYISLGVQASVDTFHFILAADTVERQGNGGSIELKNWHGSVFAMSRNGTTLSVMEY